MELFETKHRTPSINLAALIDILFLLIIFFVVSSLIIGDSGLKLVLPFNDGKNTQASGMPILEMGEDQKVTLQGKLVREQNLQTKLSALHKKSGKGILLLNIDRKVQHGRVVRLMNLVKESGFHHIVFGTQSAKPP